MKHAVTLITFALLAVMLAAAATAETSDWYTAGFSSRDDAYRGGAVADVRIRVTLVNTLDIERNNCPVIIPRVRMPLANQY
jgi:hypothetical protein